MSSKLKSWFFSTIRNTNSRGKYINFADGSEPDQVTFSNLLDTTVLKKADGDYQDQADFNAVNSESNTKFTTADNLPIIENSDNGAITLDVTPADTNSEKIKYKINPKFVTDIEEIGPNNRADDVFVAPSNLPRVVAGTTGTPVSGQAPLFQGAGFVSSFVNYYETFTITFNTLTTAFMSHSGVLLSTVLNTLRADVDAKVSDAELASEVSDLTILINNKATKVTPTVATGGNGTKVTVNSQGIVTNIDKAKASDLKNDSSVSGSTIKDALNNLNSTLAGEIVATICPLSSNETVDFTGVKGTKHLVDTTAGDVVATLPEDITSNSGDLCMISKESSDSYTITVENESTDILIVLKNENDNALFHFNDGKWGYIGVIPDPSTITRFTASAVDGITMSFNTSYICNLSANVAMTLPAITPTDYYNVITIEHYHPNNYTATITGVHDISATPTSFTDVLKTGDSVCYIAVSGIGWLHLSKDISTITQTVTNGVTDKSPSEDAVYDAIENSKGLVKDIVFKTIADSVLEVDKLNWVTLSSNHSMTIPSATISNLGKILIVNNRSSYELTIDLVTTTDVVLKGADSVLGIVCVTNGPAYNWEVFSRYNKGDFDTLVQDAINDGVTTIAPSQNAVFDALALKSPIASPTFTGTVTTPDIIVSGATASTIAHFDATKNIESLPLATYPSLTELSYVKGVTSALQTQINSAIEIAYETWTTDANYTTVNTTAKWLFVMQTGTLTASRIITLANTSVAQNVVIIAGSTVSSSIKISIQVGWKINGTINSIDIVNPYSQTWLTCTASGSWSTNQATPQFVETTTALTSSKIVRAIQMGIGNTGSFTAPFSNPVQGDIIYRKGVIMGYGDESNIAVPVPNMAYTPRTGWSNYRPNGGYIRYWDGNVIQAGNQPITYDNAVDRYVYYWGRTYSLEIRPESSANNGIYKCIFYIDGSTGVPSILKVIKDSATITASISGGAILVTGFNCYAVIKQIGSAFPTENPDLYESYSISGQIKYLTNLGIGHTSQSASAILQADSTTKGFLPPRMTNAQRTAISSPAIGLMVYCTDATEGLYIYKSTGWTFII